MGAYSDAFRKITQHEFSTETQPKIEMKVVTKIERVQPYFNGVDSKGRMTWEGREMPRWQCELLKVRYFGDFMAHWIKKRFEDATGYESPAENPSMELRAKRLETHKSGTRFRSAESIGRKGRRAQRKVGD
jgi:hypothetical protein